MLTSAESICPKRSIAKCRKLPRTESPTTNAPVSTAVAAITPRATAELLRQWNMKLRMASWKGDMRSAECGMRNGEWECEIRKLAAGLARRDRFGDESSLIQFQTPIEQARKFQTVRHHNHDRSLLFLQFQ